MTRETVDSPVEEGMQSLKRAAAAVGGKRDGASA